MAGKTKSGHHRQGLFSRSSHPRPRRRPGRLGLHRRRSRPPRRGPPGPGFSGSDWGLAGGEALRGGLPSPRRRHARARSVDQDRRRRLVLGGRGLLLPAPRDYSRNAGEAA